MAELPPGVIPALVCPRACCVPSVKAVVRTCSSCGHHVWVSWAMAPVADAGEARPTCEECTASLSARGAELVVLRHPRQRASGQSDEAFQEMADRLMQRLAGVPRA